MVLPIFSGGVWLISLEVIILIAYCRNPNLGLMTKGRACKVVGQKESPGVTPHVLESVRNYEGMNLHTPKGASILGI